MDYAITVKEFIKELKNLPPESYVKVFGDDTHMGLVYASNMIFSGIYENDMHDVLNKKLRKDFCKRYKK